MGDTASQGSKAILRTTKKRMEKYQKAAGRVEKAVGRLNAVRAKGAKAQASRSSRLAAHLKKHGI